MTDLSNAEDEALFAVFFTNAIRSAVLRANSDSNKLTSIGLALRNGWITAEGAVVWLSEIGLVDQVVGKP